MKRTGKNTQSNKKKRRKVLVSTPKQVPVDAEAPPKKPDPKKATVKKAAGKNQATLKPTAVTPVARADPADNVDVGTLLKDPAVNMLLDHANQPCLVCSLMSPIQLLQSQILQQHPPTTTRSPKPASWKPSPPLPRRSLRQLELELP
ncbi:hypothetical protein SEMRO_465_G148520.1 [Seminavis robusta]|uniref:Uncharacterized protein n=1 Tax=Seminavis robusta TaxID=568900 RepID=A0A9N8E2N1_9STRA|nr:hypothetical protein SEMRO_465_G148520.1 [Seminavis robusta]|eukprot:Sro465_g148520.1 n/a (147) ;mRNA; f:4775-5215